MIQLKTIPDQNYFRTGKKIVRDFSKFHLLIKGKNIEDKVKEFIGAQLEFFSKQILSDVKGQFYYVKRLRIKSIPARDDLTGGPIEGRFVKYVAEVYLYLKRAQKS